MGDELRARTASMRACCCYNNHHKLCGLKKYIFIIVQSWRSEALNELHGDKIKVLVGLYLFLLEGLREDLFPGLFRLLEADHAG